MNKPQLCKCGCGQMTTGFPLYKKGVLRYAEYIRGHHPNCKKKHFKKDQEPWDKGLTKETCPTLLRMGFQPGHKPYNNWDKVNERFRIDPEFRDSVKEKRKHTPWNKGLTKEQYPNGTASGPAHGNWKSNARGIRDLAVAKAIRLQTFKRDNYTCQICDKRGGNLNAHHIIPYAIDESLALDIDNLITLCKSCHIDIHRSNKKSSGNV